MKVLIANRGEIAVRIIRACREMGVSPVAAYSEADRQALHVRMADEAWHIGDSASVDSYLRVDRIVDAAVRSGATHVHPGYGFLAENAALARACADAGLVFVGPSPAAIELMGGKTAARQIARAAGVPVVPGTDMPFEEDAADALVVQAAEAVGYPLLIKAVAGGGGKGMRTAASADQLLPALRLARSEARSAFGNGACYLERRLIEPRHIEIQLLADTHGQALAFVERECSIQRRHQKVVEESPSTAVTPELRRTMAAAAVRIAQAAGYTNAGTIEFLVDSTGAFHFLEMNTRLQVEHPVTEAVTGVDFVQWQLRIARGERLTIDPERAIEPRGHAIECRVYAEDPDNGFLPSPGLVTAFSVPEGPGIRNDTGLVAGDRVPLYYDPLIAKLTVHADTRTEAVARLRRALAEYRVAGVHTTLPFFRWLVDQPDFLAARFSTTYLDGILATHRGPFLVASEADLRDAAIVAALDAWAGAQRAAGAAGSAATSNWRAAARTEALR